MRGQGEQSTSFTLDGTRFTVGKLPPRRAIRMAIRLGKVIGPGMGAAVQKMDMTKGVAGLAEANVQDVVAQLDFVKALGELADRLTTAEYDAVHDEFLWNATADLDGRQLPLLEHFDTIFDGRPFLSVQVLGKAMAFTYGNFSKLLATAADSSATAGGTLRSA